MQSNPLCTGLKMINSLLIRQNSLKSQKKNPKKTQKQTKPQVKKQTPKVVLPSS